MKLTVLQTLPALDVGGVERGTVDLARALVANGHRSIVISAGGQLVKQLLAEGSEHITLPIGKKSPLTLKYVSRLRRILRNNQVDILHTRSRLPAWISYLAWRGMAVDNRPRFVTTVHGPYTVNRYSAVMTKGERVIAVSDYIRRYILDNYTGVPAEKIRVIPRGIDPAYFTYGYRPSPEWLAQWQQDHPRFANKRLITIPGRLTHWKGQEDFIDIIANLAGRGSDIHGIIAGGAHPRREKYARSLREKVAALKLENSITFLGHRNDLREIMSVSDIVLSLATTPEAFGRTAAEALALGVPVVGYAHGGADEVLTAILPEGRVTPGDKAAVAARIAQFLDDMPVVPEKQPFTLDRMLDSTLRCYLDMISKKE